MNTQNNNKNIQGNKARSDDELTRRVKKEARRRAREERANSLSDSEHDWESDVSVHSIEEVLMEEGLHEGTFSCKPLGRVEYEDTPELPAGISRVLPPKSERKLDDSWPKLDDSWPKLGEKSTRKIKPRPKRFLVRSSYVDDLSRLIQKSTQNYWQQPSPEETAQKLKATKACRFVLPKEDPKPGEKPKFGVCYREVCTFAHSLKELQLARCNFGARCNRIHNRSRLCMFFHEGTETSDEYYNRTCKTRPLLPETNEKTRQPKPKNVKPNVEFSAGPRQVEWASRKKAWQPVVHKQAEKPALKRCSTSFLDLDKNIPTPGQVDWNKSKLEKQGAKVAFAEDEEERPRAEIRISTDKLEDLVKKGMDLSKFRVVIV